MPLRASLPVSKALRKTHSYLRLRHSRSMKTLSIQRPRPSMEMRMPAACILADIGLYRRPTRKSLHGVFLCIDNLTHTSPDHAHSPDVPGRNYYNPSPTWCYLRREGKSRGPAAAATAPTCDHEGTVRSEG